jgi:hypothetical protein
MGRSAQIPFGGRCGGRAVDESMVARDQLFLEHKQTEAVVQRRSGEKGFEMLLEEIL